MVFEEDGGFSAVLVEQVVPAVLPRCGNQVVEGSRNVFLEIAGGGPAQALVELAQPSSIPRQICETPQVFKACTTTASAPTLSPISDGLRCPLAGDVKQAGHHRNLRHPSVSVGHVGIGPGRLQYGDGSVRSLVSAVVFAVPPEVFGEVAHGPSSSAGSAASR